MKKPAPINKEALFNIDELFFSTTDSHGNIVFGNDVFMRVSGYPIETMIGAPHNIIRHPDMPRTVFKIFWRMLKSGHPIGAYVKNMSADGSYYWVFAFAFPVNNGYLSIRFKPSSKFFPVIQGLYKELLQKEKLSDMEEVEVFLLQELKKLGFNSYEDFMIKAAVEELKSLEQNTSSDESHSTSNDRVVKKISHVTAITASKLNGSFSKIGQLETSSLLLSEKILMLATEFRKLKFLSVNMDAMATHFGDSAATLAVISLEFSRIAGQIEEQMNNFSIFAEKLLGVIKTCSLNLAALKTQMNMVDFFVKESIAKNAFDGMLKNKDIFTGLFTLSTSDLFKEVIHLKAELTTISNQIFEVKKFINGLEIIKQTGAIESARNDDLKAAFVVYLNEMNTFITLLRDAIVELNSQREKISLNALEVEESTSNIKDNINQLFKLALMKAA